MIDNIEEKLETYVVVLYLSNGQVITTGEINAAIVIELSKLYNDNKKIPVYNDCKFPQLIHSDHITILEPITKKQYDDRVQTSKARRSITRQ